MFSQLAKLSVVMEHLRGQHFDRGLRVCEFFFEAITSFVQLSVHLLHFLTKGIDFGFKTGFDSMDFAAESL
ncbi:hypothetical protein P9743_03890, partial [Anoxybacillus geothermalis]|nr:hypothetical protein [Anoxybacillus geothermalis]